MPHDMPAVVNSRANEINHIGAGLFAQGELEPARLHFLAALNLEPDNHFALQNLGAVLRHMNHHAAAASVARRSVRASGGNVFCRSNYGVSLLSLKQYRAAVDMLRTVLHDLPDSAPSYHNLGLALYMIGHYDEALICFEKCLALTPDNLHCQSDRGLTLLALGKLQAGLEAYEVRWRILTPSLIWGLGIPEWKGEPISGLHLLVHHEQGFGDSLMLSRFVPSLVNQGAKVTLAVPAELIRLFSVSFGPSVRVVDFKDQGLENEVFDYHTPLLSAMRHLGVVKVSEIFSAPYLLAPKDDVIRRLPQNSRYKIGLCWASGNHGPSLVERRRVTNLVDYLPLTEIPGASVISLQMGGELGNIAANGMEGLILDLSFRIEDFASTAAIIAELDVVVSVDSAVAHLAGALGVPCIMLSPFTRCWRWWGAPLGTGQPWYNAMKVLYQSEDGTWTKAVAQAVSGVRRILGVD